MTTVWYTRSAVLCDSQYVTKEKFICIRTTTYRLIVGMEVVVYVF
jgi:hypothetical protein